MSATVLELLANWGSPFLFGLLFLAALGIPLPATLTLIAAGALIVAGTFDVVAVAPWAAAGSIAGDHMGYGLGRLAGHAVDDRLAGRQSWQKRLAEARSFMARRGAFGVFFTRWLATPLGPPVNIAAGMARLPLWRFSIADIAGEVLWVALFLGIGAFAGAGAEELAALAGDFGGFVAALIVTVTLGWFAFGRRRAKGTGTG
ncbi:MAG: VTT domain-containing protein [Rhizobiaceae bacterium]